MSNRIIHVLKVEYDGTNYSGWQRQNNGNSVQQAIEDALKKLTGHEIHVLGSGRTDAGVHAVGQVAQADFVPSESLEQCVYKINMALPTDISIIQIREVHPDAQCRFDAISRSYRYAISRKKNPLKRNYAHCWLGPLDLSSMNECCSIIRESTDFQAFSKVQTQVPHFRCKVSYAQWSEQEADMLVFDICANRFLRGMVRALVGTMLEVGKGKKTVMDFKEILAGKNRRLAGESAPAEGLFLMDVQYPETIYL